MVAVSADEVPLFTANRYRTPGWPSRVVNVLGVLPNLPSNWHVAVSRRLRVVENCRTARFIIIVVVFFVFSEAATDLLIGQLTWQA